MDSPWRIASRTRQAAGGRLIEGFFRGASRLGRVHPRADPARHGVRVRRDLPYLPTGRREHRLDLYEPIDPPPDVAGPGGSLPTILYVHGGGFRILSKDTHWLPSLLWARRGYRVFTISYRLAPRFPFPAALQDTAAALAWIAEHGPAHGADLDRVGFAGESAGANLVAGLMVCTCFRRPEPWARAAFDLGVVPRAVFPAMGMLQVSDPERLSRRRPLPRFLVDRIEEVTRAYLPDGAPNDLADPLVVLERPDRPDRPLPPVYACVGTADPLLDDTRRLGAALAARGVEHQISYFPGEIHAFHVFLFRPAARRCWSEMLAFSDRHVAPRADPLLARAPG